MSDTPKPPKIPSYFTLLDAKACQVGNIIHYVAIWLDARTLGGKCFEVTIQAGAGIQAIIRGWDNLHQRWSEPMASLQPPFMASAKLDPREVKLEKGPTPPAPFKVDEAELLRIVGLVLERR